ARGRGRRTDPFPSAGDRDGARIAFAYTRVAPTARLSRCVPHGETRAPQQTGRALRALPLSRNDSARFHHSSLATNRRHGSRKRNRFAGRPPMTGMSEQVRPGIGHNEPDEYAEEKKHEKWERWAKKRTFVRALEGTYSHLYKALLEEKRVYPSRDVAWKGGPGQFGKSVISPQATG